MKIDQISILVTLLKLETEDLENIKRILKNNDYEFITDLSLLDDFKMRFSNTSVSSVFLDAKKNNLQYSEAVKITQDAIIYDCICKEKISIDESIERFYSDFIIMVSQVSKNLIKINDIEYRLGIVIRGETDAESTDQFIDLDKKLDAFFEKEISVNKVIEKDIFSKKYFINNWIRVYFNENSKSYLMDINNHIKNLFPLKTVSLNDSIKAFTEIINDKIKGDKNDGK